MSDDYMKYDGRYAEPPYETAADRLATLERENAALREQVAGLTALTERLRVGIRAAMDQSGAEEVANILDYLLTLTERALAEQQEGRRK